jgi:cell division protein FtsL
MRDAVVWGTALALLLAALHTVEIRREVASIGRQIGRIESAREEMRKRNENRELELERLRSPARLLDRAVRKGVLPEEER